jgi:hypothetical protein
MFFVSLKPGSRVFCPSHWSLGPLSFSAFCVMDSGLEHSLFQRLVLAAPRGAPPGPGGAPQGPAGRMGDLTPPGDLAPPAGGMVVHRAGCGWQVWEVHVVFLLRGLRLFSRTVRYATRRRVIAPGTLLWVVRQVRLELSDIRLAPRGFSRHVWVSGPEVEDFLEMLDPGDQERGPSIYVPPDF